MTSFPPTRPGIIYWKTSTDVVLTSIFADRGKNVSDLPRRTAKPWKPYGVVAWAYNEVDGKPVWHPLDQLPAAWKIPEVDGVPFDPASEEDEDDESRSRANEAAFRRYAERKRREEKGMFGGESA